MSDLKLFNITGIAPIELKSQSAILERDLQNLVGKHLEIFLGIRFLVNEHPTENGLRIDTLGIDGNNRPVIIEYKRSTASNIISQILAYRSWLTKHKSEFQLLVQKKIGHEISDHIEWRNPRLLCIAQDYPPHDYDAAQDANIELIRYRQYSNDLLALEVLQQKYTNSLPILHKVSEKYVAKTNIQYSVDNTDSSIQDLNVAIKTFLVGLGNDVIETPRKTSDNFKRNENFASIVVLKNSIKVYVCIDPTTVVLEDGFTRNVGKPRIGHLGNGGLEIVINSLKDLEKAKPLMIKSYNLN